MKKQLGIFVSIIVFALLILGAAEVTESARYALSLCAGLIVPTLFPFFVISILLNRLGLPAILGRLLNPTLGRLFRVSGAGVSALIIGLCGGYPMGAAYIADMLRAGHIKTEEAEHLLCFCNNSGPAFIISAVGVGVFASPAAGALLYLIHILSALISGVLIRGKGFNTRDTHVHIETMSFFAAFPLAVRQAVISVLNVCGFVVSFTALLGLLDRGGLISLICGRLSQLTGMEISWFHALLAGFVELGSGAGAMQGMALTPLNFALASMLLGWGGLSVHFQTRALLADSEAKGALHGAGRLLSAAISAILAFFISPLL